jgi:hypothetical protein
MSRRRTLSGELLALVAAMMVVLSGCGSGVKPLHPAGHASTTRAPGVPAEAVHVIVGWSEALRAGHVSAAARYFRIPSVFFAGSGPPLQLRSLTQVETANAALPCGARLISARIRGHYVNALFKLTGRPGPGGAAGCGSGAGETARTNFLIRNGRIVEWLRAPDEPGDNGSPRQTPAQPPSQGAPGTTPDGKPVV